MTNQLYSVYRNNCLAAVHLSITAATNPSSGTGNGGSDGISAPVSSTQTLTVASGAFTSADVGRYITVSGATNPLNNGNFVITAQGGTTVSYTNASGVAQTSFAGAWVVPITLTTSTVHNLVDGAFVRVAGVLGQTAANGSWALKTGTAGLSTSQFQIFDGNNIAAASGNTYPGFPGFGVAGIGAYTSGGYATNAVDWLGDNIKTVIVDNSGGHYSPSISSDIFLSVVSAIDRLDAATTTVTAATNATPIVVTAANTYTAGQEVVISGVLGNTAANGTWIISSVSGTGFTLNNSIGNGAYTSGGTVHGGFTTTSPNLSTKIAIAGGAGAAITTLPLVALDTRSLGAVLGFADTGSVFTSPLIFKIDIATGLPITPSGGDITESWQQTSPYIYTL